MQSSCLCLGDCGFTGIMRQTYRLTAVRMLAAAPLLLLQEVQALAALGSHQNIVQYYSAWAEPDMQVRQGKAAAAAQRWHQGFWLLVACESHGCYLQHIPGFCRLPLGR